MSKKRSAVSVKDKAHVKKSTVNPKNKYESDKKSIDGVVQAYIDACQASATKRAYASDLRHFLAHGGSIPSTVKRLVTYLAESANDGLAVATLERRVTAIHKAHLEHKLPSPAHSEAVKQVLQGIRRTLGTKQRQVMPLTKEVLLNALAAMKCEQMPAKAARDRALLLVGFASGMRRSELVGIRVEHLIYSDIGLEIELPVSKTDQERHGRTVFIPLASNEHCPVRALKNWLKVSGISEGYVFRAVSRFDHIARDGLSAQSVALIIKGVMAKTGADASHISGHSLRAGYCTSAAELGLKTGQIREQTGHKSDLMLARYIRRASLKSIQSLL